VNCRIAGIDAFFWQTAVAWMDPQERFSLARRFPTLNLREFLRRQLDSSNAESTFRNSRQRTRDGLNGYSANNLGIGVGARRAA